MSLSVELGDWSEEHGVPKLIHAPDGASASDKQFDGSFVTRIESSEVPGAVAIGPGGYLVGFAPVCTHMGCLVFSEKDDGKKGILAYKRAGGSESESLVCGPCPCHGTTFDLMKGGLVVLGPATQNLPQIKLEVEGNRVIAKGWITNDRQDVDPRFENWPDGSRLGSPDNG